jgi:hypothetical protein
VSYTIGNGDARHRQGFFQIRGAVVYSRQNVSMYVDHIS